MIPVEELYNLKERLAEKSRGLAIEIELITAWIQEHRETRPARIEAFMSTPDERSEYRSWRKISNRLHQRRSELKTKQEKIWTHLLVVDRRIEETETGIINFPVFPDITLETYLSLVDACA